MAAVGKREVSGGNGKLGNAITGSGRFAESDSYSGVKGGFSEQVAGYLVSKVFKIGDRKRGMLWIVPYSADIVSLLKCDQLPLA
jgi:hypothetical protein